MGEQPIWTTRAQIFEIDRATKTSWIPCTKQAIPISFYHDTNRKTYRIISVEGSKAILNSTITPNTVFTKTAQKFGQWSDPKAGTIYGVGFPNEEDLLKFSEIFQQAKEPDTHSKSLTVENGKPKYSINRSSSMNSNSSTGSANQDEVPPSSNSSKTSNSIDAQLKYENDKLKLALAQSSANAKKWETELQNLRNNNARLTTALQESTSNVEEWKKQLLMYKEENEHLRLRVQELTKKENAEGFSQIQAEKNSLESKVGRLEKSLEQQSNEIAKMTLELSEAQTLKLTNNELADKVRDLKVENEKLQKVSYELSSKQRIIDEQKGKIGELEELFSKMKSHFAEMNHLRETMDKRFKA
ncbi:homer protein homolog 2-like isoform X1 [Xenia sp. Carnegie-2017]|uniref:homer protein homolog 2-like isoform X1 n=1 Tax=Xenia sp. Carnegie-2017 TaxID=2897299 RepID=UPI001F03EED5|nr:homer protein homolog 2-like isoform X1 [Xenia sp. Carnegie-2017]